MIATRIRATALALAMAGLVAGAAAQAAEESGGGTVTYVPVSSETTTLPNGDTLVRDHVKGVVMADDPAAPYHLASQDCMSTAVIAKDGGPPISTGVCDGVDKQGNMWWVWIRSGPDGGTWGFLGGTGAYAGNAGGGMAKVEAHWPDGRYVTRWQGKWTTK
jgi:hypothetical protein